MDNFNVKAIGRRLSAERERCKADGRPLTLDALSEKIGVTRQTLSKWEKGAGDGPTLWDMVRLCDFYGCDLGYLTGEYDCRTRITTDIREETGLSELAVDNLRIAAGGPDEGPIREVIEESPHSRIRDYEVGRFAKIRFIEALLENDKELERIAVAAFDYRRQMQEFEKDSTGTVGGIRHDQFANVAKEAAKEALADLFAKITCDTFDGIEWSTEE